MAGELEKRVSELEEKFRNHNHNGFDNKKVSGSDLANSKPLNLSDVQFTPLPEEGSYIYMTGDKLVVVYDDSGTIRYKYLTLSGVGDTWTATTIAP